MNQLCSPPTLTRNQSCAEISQNLVSDIYCFLVNSWAGPSAPGGGDRWGGDPPRQEAAGPHQTGWALCRPAQTERGVLRRGNIHNITPPFSCCALMLSSRSMIMWKLVIIWTPEMCRLFQVLYHKNLHFSSWVVNVNMGCCFDVKCKFYTIIMREHSNYKSTLYLNLTFFLRRLSSAVSKCKLYI